MMYWHDGHGMSGWDWALAAIGMIVFWGVLIAAAVALFRYLARNPQRGQTSSGAGAPPSPQAILAERFARGEIDEDEYRARLAVLRNDHS